VVVGGQAIVWPKDLCQNQEEGFECYQGMPHGGWKGKFGSFLESKNIREGEGVGATMEN